LRLCWRLLMGKNERTKPQEHYLKIPYGILNMREIGQAEKLLLAHIHSFGTKGCWQSNATLGKMFFATPRTITSWIGNLKKVGCILWLHPKGRYRTLWSRLHPGVKAATMLPYMGREIPKAAVVTGQGGDVLLGRNLPGSSEGGFRVTAKNGVLEVGRNLPHTKNTIKRDTTGATTATPSPLPAGGQAPALLEDRQAEAVAQLEELKRSIGLGPRQARVRLTAADEQRRKQEIIAGLRASKAV